MTYLKTFLLYSIVALLFACGGGTHNANVKVSPEMEAFTTMFDGKYTGVQAAISKYGITNLDTKDMDTKDLREPKITEATSQAGQDCYTLFSE